MVGGPPLFARHIGTDDVIKAVFPFEYVRVAHAFFAERLQNDGLVVVERFKTVAVLAYGEMDTLFFSRIADKIAEKIFSAFAFCGFCEF